MSRLRIWLLRHGFYEIRGRWWQPDASRALQAAIDRSVDLTGHTVRIKRPINLGEGEK